jgi:DNA helicase-2/ATP-dependent DNA helicase PcrA
VFVLNVVDGSFPSEFAAAQPAMIDEERRLLYVAMTRARDELQLLHPLKFPLTQQAPRGEAHVYGARSRFITDKVLKCFEQSSYSARVADASLASPAEAVIDATSRLKDMW